MRGEAEAVLRLVPLSTSSTANQASKSTLILTAASAAQSIPGTNADPRQGGLVWITLAPDQNMRIAFGTSTVVAVATDRLIFAGAETDYCVPPGITHFSVIRTLVDGALSWHVSS